MQIFQMLPHNKSNQSMKPTAGCSAASTKEELWRMKWRQNSSPPVVA